jgi:hypothetical protein
MGGFACSQQTVDVSGAAVGQSSFGPGGSRSRFLRWREKEAALTLADGELFPAEEGVRRAMAKGVLADLREGDHDADDPRGGETWRPGRTVRADVLAQLLTGVMAVERPRALRLAGARIVGMLDLEAARLLCPALFLGCWFEQPVNLAEACVPALRLPGCQLPGLRAAQLTVRGNLELNDGFTARGEINLLGAHIGGRFICSGATLASTGRPALNGERLTVGQSMVCRAKFTAFGELRLRGAHILGDLDFGEANLVNPDGRALSAGRLAVDQDLICGQGFTARGEVCLIGARIGGDLDFGGATLANADGPALYANRLTVGQSMFCRAKFSASGEVRLLGASIGGRLSFATATLANPGGIALQAERLAVAQDIFFTEEFAAAGEIRLVGAQVGGNADFTGCKKLSSERALTLNLAELQAASLVLRTLVPPDEAELTSATVGRLADEPASWPCGIRLRGFTYDVLDEGRTVSARERLGWLARDPDGYSPQPYEQLAAVYRRAGREQDVRKIAIARQRARRRTLSPPSRLWSLLLDVLIGYGFRTWLAGVWLLGWWAVGTLVFAAAYPHHLVLATPGVPHPAFQPVIYALDVLLPVVDLHQQATWIPQGPVRWFAWASILAGWLLATAVVAAITGVVKRD